MKYTMVYRCLICKLKTKETKISDWVLKSYVCINCVNSGVKNFVKGINIMDYCRPCIDEGSSSTPASRLVNQNGNTKVPMCDKHWRNSWIGDKTGMARLPDLDDGSELIKEELVGEAKVPVGYKLCMCGCKGTLLATSKFNFIRGHKGKLTYIPNKVSPVFVSNDKGTDSIRKAVQFIEADIALHKSQISTLETALVPLKRLIQEIR